MLQGDVECKLTVKPAVAIIMNVIQRGSQCVVGNIFCRQTRCDKLFYRFVFKKLIDQIQAAIGEAESVNDHGHNRFTGRDISSGILCLEDFINPFGNTEIFYRLMPPIHDDPLFE